jgi:hypothetical protein
LQLARLSSAPQAITRPYFRRNSRFIQLIQSAEICLGQTASHSSWLLQLPKPSAAMRSVIAKARR